MDGFGWSTQRHPAAASCPGDDALLAAFLGGASATSLELLHSATAGDISDAAYGHELPPSCQDDDLRRLLRCRDSVSPLPFAVDDPPKSAFLHNSAGSLLRAPAPPPIAAHDSFVAFFSNAGDAFSGTAAGNISSGESNTCCRPGGRDAEVASPPIPPETRTTTGTEATEQETIYRAAAMRPVVVVEPRQTSSSSPAPAAEPHHPPRRRRRNVRISSEPQTVAARLRREKVSERLRALRRLVPGGGSGKMDTASMLHQAACYLRFLKAQLARFQAMAADGDGRYSSSSSSSSSMQRYVGRPPPWNSNPECLGDGRDGVAAGYVRPSNRNMQSL